MYLLDDPLAAVDAYVARHLYTHCIMGLMGHKTRILCTHHHRFTMLCIAYHNPFMFMLNNFITLYSIAQSLVYTILYLLKIPFLQS